MQSPVAQAVTWIVTIAAVVYMARQVRKPGFGFGRPIIWMMNQRHFDVTTWGLSHVEIGKSFRILDVGCGGGRTINRLAALTTANVSGIDYSAESVAVARQTNAELMAAGRVDIQKGSVSHLPWNEATFDLVTAVETHYYWPEPVADMREVLRVLKPGGRLLLIAETYKGQAFDAPLGVVMKALGARYLTLDEHRELLTSAGFAPVHIFNQPQKGWVCAVGQRPAD